MSASQPPDGIISAICTLSADGRLIVPADLRKSLSWLAGERPIALVVELLVPGRVRVSPQDALQPRIEAARRRLVREHEHPAEFLAGLADRYRAMRYYPSDTRLHFGDATVAFLRGAQTGDQPLYIETLGDHMDLMTLAVRNNRLERLATDLELRGTD